MKHISFLDKETRALRKAHACKKGDMERKKRKELYNLWVSTRETPYVDDELGELAPLAVREQSKLVR